MSNSFEANEHELLIRLKQGDSMAFELLYNKYKEGLAGKFLKLLRDDELAKDALQELFTRVWNNRASIDTEKSFRAYLFRIAQNLVIDYYRKAARDKNMQALLLQEDNWYQEIEERLMGKEYLNWLYAVIDKLPPQQRNAYYLHKIEGKSYKEISEEMGISMSTINKHIHYAHRFVKSQLIASPFILKTIIAIFLLTQ